MWVSPPSDPLGPGICLADDPPTLCSLKDRRCDDGHQVGARLHLELSQRRRAAAFFEILGFSCGSSSQANQVILEERPFFVASLCKVSSDS